MYLFLGVMKSQRFTIQIYYKLNVGYYQIDDGFSGNYEWHYKKVAFLYVVKSLFPLKKEEIEKIDNIINYREREPARKEFRAHSYHDSYEDALKKINRLKKKGFVITEKNINNLEKELFLLDV